MKKIERTLWQHYFDDVPGWLMLAARAGFAVAALGILFLYLDTPVVLSRLAAIDGSIFILVCAILTIQYLMSFWRWQYILYLQKIPLGIVQNYSIYGMGALANLTLFNAIAGMSVRGVLLVRAGVSGSKIVITLLTERFAAAGGVLACLAGSFFFSIFFLDNLSTPMNIPPWLVPAMVMAVAVTGIAIGLLWQSRTVKQFMKSVRKDYFSARVVILLFIISIFIVYLGFSAVAVLAASMNLEIDLISLFFVLPVVAFMSALPISVGGWGVREGTMAAGLALFGVLPEDSVALSISYGLVSAFVTAVIGSTAVMAYALDPRTHRLKTLWSHDDGDDRPEAGSPEANTVMHVITGLGSGGAEAMLVQLAMALQARGMPQYVVSLKDGGVHAEALEASRVPVTTLNVSSFASAPAAIFRLIRLVRRINPATLQGWMYHGNLASVIAHRLASGRDDRKLYWNLRASNMDLKRYGRIIGWNARLSGYPDMIMANSEAGRDFHLGQGFHPRQMAVVHNGIDTQKFCPDERERKAMRKKLGLGSDDIVAVHVARVDLMKDHENFLAAMKACPDITGLLVGMDTDTLVLPENVKALGLRHDVERLYRAADLIVSSSAFGEGFSNTTAEGMASGLVPVVTEVGDAKTIVGKTGRVVAPRNSQALANAIAAEAGVGKKKLRENGLNARRRIVEGFTLEKSVEAFAKIYSRPHDQ